MKITIQKANDYKNPINCGIAKGLRKKLIIAIVHPTYYIGLFLGFIPIWGNISLESNEKALMCTDKDFEPVEVEVGVYNKIKNEEQW